MDAVIKLFGNFDENVKVLTSEFGTQIALSDNKLQITGDNAPLCKEVAEKLLELIYRGEEIDRGKIIFGRWREDKLAESRSSTRA